MACGIKSREGSTDGLCCEASTIDDCTAADALIASITEAAVSGPFWSGTGDAIACGGVDNCATTLDDDFILTPDASEECGDLLIGGTYFFYDAGDVLLCDGTGGLGTIINGLSLGLVCKTVLGVTSVRIRLIAQVEREGLHGPDCSASLSWHWEKVITLPASTADILSGNLSNTADVDPCSAVSTVPYSLTT